MDTDIAEVRIDPPGLQGLLGVPVGASGIVIFAHGSGSGRLGLLDQVVEYAIDWFLVHLDPGEN
jgi:hypothetical protein